MTTFSVIMPVYNVELFVQEAIQSVLNQTFTDFELIIVDDCGQDRSRFLCEGFNDSRISILTHPVNKGLAAARNTGIRHAKGNFIAFLDADDTWHSEKLALHYAHLEANPKVGLSFSRSTFIQANGESANCYQMPRLKDIQPHHIFLRNPIGNGSAPVIRKETLKDIGFINNEQEGEQINYFDESLRRSEDIECWVRIALETTWQTEGIPQPLTNYRLNDQGLSSSLAKQYESWRTVFQKIAIRHPKFIEKYGRTAQAYQYRYLARQAIRLKIGSASLSYWSRAMISDWRILINEPSRTLATLLSAGVLFIAPALFKHLEKVGLKFWGRKQLKVIKNEI